MKRKSTQEQRHLSKDVCQLQSRRLLQFSFCLIQRTTMKTIIKLSIRTAFVATNSKFYSQNWRHLNFVVSREAFFFAICFRNSLKLFIHYLHFITCHHAGVKWIFHHQLWFSKDVLQAFFNRCKGVSRIIRYKFIIPVLFYFILEVRTTRFFGNSPTLELDLTRYGKKYLFPLCLATIGEQ